MSYIFVRFLRSTCALSSTASEARSTSLKRQGHRGGRSAKPDGPYHSVDRPRRLIKYQGGRKPTLLSFVACQTTRAPTR